MTEHEVDGGLILDAVIRESTAILEPLAAEGGAVDQVDARLVEDLSLDVIDRVRRFDLGREDLADEHLREDPRHHNVPNVVVASEIFIKGEAIELGNKQDKSEGITTTVKTSRRPGESSIVIAQNSTTYVY